jgi:hypothetical protein
VEDGDVTKIRDKIHGTKDWRPNAMTNYRRSRLYKILKDDFDLDREKFYTFFTVGNIPSEKRPDSTQYISTRRLDDARKKMKDQIDLEQRKPEYMDDEGRFSSEKWQAVWGDKNRWAVWRELGLERY